MKTLSTVYWEVFLQPFKMVNGRLAAFQTLEMDHIIVRSTMFSALAFGQLSTNCFNYSVAISQRDKQVTNKELYNVELVNYMNAEDLMDENYDMLGCWRDRETCIIFTVLLITEVF